MIKLNKDTNSIIDDLSKFFYRVFVASTSDDTDVTDVSEHDVSYVDAFLKRQATGFAQYYVLTKGLLGVYTNGNYQVAIFSDGTKIRYNDENELIPDSPESMDIKITDMCDVGCPYCHENSSVNGKHGDIMNQRFIRELPEYTELAIGGGNPLSHPQLLPFLLLCKQKNLIPSITVNQKHFMDCQDMIKLLVDKQLIYGLGISLTDPTDEFLDTVKQFPNAVIHVIAGVVSDEQLHALYDKDLKLLILGYKEFRRGEAYHSASVDYKIVQLRDNLSEVIKHFNVISFDNLAIMQLDVRHVVQDWDTFYMGDDGQFTMYVDMVKHEYAKSSTSTVRHSYTDDLIDDMFSVVRSEG